MKKIKVSEQALVSVPKLIGFESPASWLSRAALSQGVGNRELLHFLELGHSRDFDLEMSWDKAQGIAVVCGIPVEIFRFASRMFTTVRSIDSTGEQFLMSSKRRGVTYRYCPGCLNDQKIKYFPLHWRFTRWRYCPIHECLMESRCLHCGSEVRLAVDMISAGLKGRGVASLDRCLECEGKLSSHYMQVLEILGKCSLSYEESRLLKNGRATLAAVYHGHYMEASHPGSRFKLASHQEMAYLLRPEMSDVDLSNQALLRRVHNAAWL